MKKFFSLLFIVAAVHTQAQTSTTEVQTIDMQLVNVIKMVFTNTGGSNVGSTVNLTMGTMNELTNGVTSTNSKLKIKSTKPFNVNVKASSPTFSYSGSSTQNNVMEVEDVLQLKVNQNQTGGNIGSGYNTFSPITYGAQNIISGGDNGDNQKFRFKYRAIPGLGYAAGTYLATIVYTATQQ